MKTKHLLVFGFIAGGALISPALAQKNTVASGGEGTGSGGNISYSIGQIDYKVATGAGGKAGEGLQQPFEIYTTVGLDEKNIDLTYKVYPNPTSDFLTLSISNYTAENFSFVVMSIDGRVVSTGKVSGNETIISMESLASGQYLVNINSNSSLIKSFKVIKN